MENTKYYVRKSGSSEILGTFAIAELREQLCSGRLTRDWEAIVATGQSYGQLRRATGWTRVGLVVGDDGHHDERSDDLPTASFTCVVCDVRMRLHLREAICRCPRCRTNYRIQRVSDSPLAFLLVPELERMDSKPARPARRACPPEVKAALLVFGLDETTTLEGVRQTYRELVKGCHPDKVAHLDADLRHVAEAKTKKINGALKVLEKFYAA